MSRNATSSMWGRWKHFRIAQSTIEYQNDMQNPQGHFVNIFQFELHLFANYMVVSFQNCFYDILIKLMRLIIYVLKLFDTN